MLNAVEENRAGERVQQLRGPLAEDRNLGCVCVSLT